MEKDVLRVIQYKFSGVGMKLSEDKGEWWRVKLQTRRFEGKPQEVLYIILHCFFLS
jgi:hypothetical protein